MTAKRKKPRPPQIQDITIKLRSGREVTGRFVDGQLELDGPMITKKDLTPEFIRALCDFLPRLEEMIAAKKSRLDPETGPPAPPSTGSSQRNGRRAKP